MSRPAATPRPRRPRRVERIGARVAQLGAALLGAPRVAMAHRVWNRYNASSGPLLARGLAFTALFMLVPALLLIASIAGLFGGNLDTRARIVGFLTDQFPPLADLLRRTLDTALAHAGELSLIGAAILAWSASSLVRDLDRAFGTIFGRPARGRTIARMVAEVVAVAAAVVGLGLLAVVATVPGPVSRLLGLTRLRVTAVLPLMARLRLHSGSFRGTVRNGATRSSRRPGLGWPPRCLLGPFRSSGRCSSARLTCTAPSPGSSLEWSGSRTSASSFSSGRPGSRSARTSMRCDPQGRRRRPRDDIERPGAASATSGTDQPWRVPQRRQKRAFDESDRPHVTHDWTPTGRPASEVGAARRSRLDTSQTGASTDRAAATRAAHGAVGMTSWVRRPPNAGHGVEAGCAGGAPSGATIRQVGWAT